VVPVETHDHPSREARTVLQKPHNLILHVRRADRKVTRHGQRVLRNCLKHQVEPPALHHAHVEDINEVMARHVSKIGRHGDSEALETNTKGNESRMRQEALHIRALVYERPHHPFVLARPLRMD